MFNFFSKDRLPKRWRADALRALVETTARPDVIE